MIAPALCPIPDSVHTVGDIVAAAGAVRVLLVTGEDSYHRCGGEAALGPVLTGLEVTHLRGFGINPDIEDVRRGIDVAAAAEPDVVVAVGGGSVLDMAKLVNAFWGSGSDPLDQVRGQPGIRKPGVPLVAVPTTAGSGSEATQFAVFYIGDVKQSVDHPWLLPDHVVLDPQLTWSMPPELSASCGMDALCQAVESMWSVRSTRNSRRQARDAARTAWEMLPRSVQSPTPESRYFMMRAANLAGRAINVSRTTAAHAVSYHLTSRYGIPHGHAVALILGELIPYNAGVEDDDVCHPRGAAHVRGIIEEICGILGASSPEEARDVWYDRMAVLGKATTLGPLGITEVHVGTIAEAVNADRLANNPRRMVPGDLRALLSRRVVRSRGSKLEAAAPRVG